MLANEVVSPRLRMVEKVEEEEEGYHPKLHAYAIRMLAELEDAQKEVSHGRQRRRECSIKLVADDDE